MTNKFEQLIELFIAEDEQGAKDLFHEIVVEKSRDIYESLTDEDQVEETAEVDEDAVEEAEEIEESDFDEAELGGDAADDMIDDIEADEQGLAIEGHDDDDEELEDRVVDLEDALDELKAEFERIMAGDDDEPEMDMDMDDEEVDMDDDESDMDMDDMDDESEDEMADEMVREYKEKVSPPSNSEEGDGKSGPVAGKNPIGNAANAKNLNQGGDGEKVTPQKPKVQTDAANPKGATMKKA